ncbi:hypothetical protein ACFE6N_21315 [Pedobacter sp. BG31]
MRIKIHSGSFLAWLCYHFPRVYAQGVAAFAIRLPLATYLKDSTRLAALISLAEVKPDLPVFHEPFKPMRKSIVIN